LKISGKSKQQKACAERNKERQNAAAALRAAAPQTGPGGQGVQHEQVEEGPAAARGAAMEIDASLERAQEPRPGRLKPF